MSRHHATAEIAFGGVDAHGGHILGYQVHLTGATTLPNALLIPLPTSEPQSVTFIDTGDSDDFMRAIGQTVPRLSTPEALLSR